jgi:hypothetical protein
MKRADENEKEKQTQESGELLAAEAASFHAN